jgi:hypothetical protein
MVDMPTKRSGVGSAKQAGVKEAPFYESVDVRALSNPTKRAALWQARKPHSPNKK